MRPEIVSRDPQVRSAHVFRSEPASMAPSVGSVAEEVKDSNVNVWSTCRRGPLGVGLWLVRSVLSACFNVDARTSPAHSGRIYVPAACPVGFKLIGVRERA